MNKISAIQPDTLRRKVEDAVREAITSGVYAPGERLIERELCEGLGVSRASVREALRRLEAEKLVHTVPHRGPVVASIPGASLYSYSGCPAVGLPSWRKFLRSSSESPYPER